MFLTLLTPFNSWASLTSPLKFLLQPSITKSVSVFIKILTLSAWALITSWTTLYSYFFISSKCRFKYVGNNKCMLTIDNISTHFPCFKYPKDANICFCGWIPMQFEDDDFIYNIGLPQRIYPGHEIRIKNLDEKTERVFTHDKDHKKAINWEEIFDEFVKHKFHDELD